MGWMWRQKNGLTKSAMICESLNCLQHEIEDIIQQMIPDYNYGSRREDPTAIINENKLFGQVSYLEQDFKVEMSSNMFFDGWKSHATLERQAGEKFASVLERIQELLARHEVINVPYSTRIWFAPLTVEKTGWRSESFQTAGSEFAQNPIGRG
jgi:hypothetical protein